MNIRNTISKMKYLIVTLLYLKIIFCFVFNIHENFDNKNYLDLYYSSNKNNSLLDFVNKSFNEYDKTIKKTDILHNFTYVGVWKSTKLKNNETLFECFNISKDFLLNSSVNINNITNTFPFYIRFKCYNISYMYAWNAKIKW